MSEMMRFLQPAYIDEGRFIVQRPVLERLIEYAKPSGACLNIGCGELMYLPWLDGMPDLTKFVHMDLSTPYSEAVGGNPRHRSLPGSITEMPFPDGSFQFVLCTEVMEHIEDHHKAASEIARVLTPGGVALISTPTPPAPFDANHVREGYTLPEMKQLLEGHGLDVVQAEYSFHFCFRALYKVWASLLRLRGGYSAMPRFVLRGWSHLDRTVPIGKPWDIAVIARKRAAA